VTGARFRDAFRVRPGYWFRPKRFGIGAVPVTWQGWAATFAFLPIIAVIVNFATHRDRLWLLLLLPVVGAYLGLVASKTDGGWRFRWGGDA